MNTRRSLITGILVLLTLMTVPAGALAALDTTQPTTSATLTGTKGSDGWYTTSVTVTLSATDGADGSGVARTEYSLDNATWQTYSAPFVLTTDGVQYVYFRSTDLAGNVETPAKSQEIKINKTGLVGLWHMDGNWKDASVVGNQGTPYSGVSFSSNAKVGTNAGSFNGSSSYVKVSDSPTIHGNLNLTVIGWIYVNSFNKTYQSIFFKGNSPDCTNNCDNREYALYLHSSGHLELRSTPADRVGIGELGLNTPDGVIQTGGWNHIAALISSDQNVMKIYVNGQEKASTTYSTAGIRTTSGALLIGNNPFWNGTFYGLIDEFTIYNRALSATEILSLYRNYLVKSPTVNLVPSPTATPTITLSGTKSANTAILVNGNTLVPFDATTIWQAAYTLSPGTNNLTITAQSSQNFKSLPVALTVVLDTTPPAVPTINPVSTPISSTSKTITGTMSSDSASVTVSCAGATIGTISYPTATSWIVAVSGLSEGVNIITASAADVAGNQSSVASETIIVDTNQPAVGATPAGATYNSPQSIVLAATEPAIIYYTMDGSTPTTSATIYSQPISIPAPVTIKYFAIDLAGNESEIKTEKYVIDTTPPVLVISTLSDGAYTTNETLNIAGTVTDDWEAAGITVNDTAVPLHPDGSFSHALLLKSGGNTLTVVATDSAGNTATETRTVTLDQTAPILTVAAPADNSKTGNVLLEVSGTVDETSAVTVTTKDIVQSAVMNGGSFSATIILEPGYNTIEITASDLAGNRSTVKRTVVFDDQVPSLAVTVPNQDIRTNQGSLTIKGTAFDALTAVGVTIKKDNEVFTPPVIDGTFEQTVNFAEERTYGIVVTATNEVGTSASVQRNVIYDITPPLLGIDPVTTPTSQPSQSVSGTREAGAMVTVTCATATVLGVIYPTATTWQADIFGLREGKNVITAASADTAGNAVTSTATVVLALIPPQVTITATPAVIWPPNHQKVPVTISGGVAANGSDIKSVSISVRDEYGKFAYDNLTFGSTVMLEAWRNGNDTDGRKYTITVVVTTRGGVTTSKTATVTVPHDQSKSK